MNQNYVDHYLDPVLDITAFLDGTEDTNVAADLSKDSTGGSAKFFQTQGEVTFPVLIYRILQESRDCGTEHIISWSHHGRSFEIQDRIEFEGVVMPRYFNTKRFTSFVRQAKYYKFIRIGGRSMNCIRFYHEYFLRGRPDLLACIPRSVRRVAREQEDAASQLAISGVHANEPMQPHARIKNQLNAMPQFETFPTCRKLRSAEIAFLCRDPKCNPRQMFPFQFGTAQQRGLPDPNKPGHYQILAYSDMRYTGMTLQEPLNLDADDVKYLRRVLRSPSSGIK